MAEIKAAEVQKLRMQTGAGMMDCKKALIESGGDFEKAIDYLRKKGQKVATKRADKDANEGIVLAKTNTEKTFAVNLMLNCEPEAASVFAYIHQGNRLATTVGFNKADTANIEDIGHEIAMQIAAMNPVAIDKDNVDPTIVEREIEIGKEQARQEGKPEAILEKIAMGKLNKFYKENTLLNQNFVRDTKMTVRQYLAGVDKDLKITSFTRLMLGE